MNLRRDIDPSTLILMEMESTPTPALMVGETVVYDHVHIKSVSSLEQFKRYLDKRYEYKLVNGSELPLAWATYEIIAVKDTELQS